MKKSNILLFVMSLVSFGIAVLGVFAAVAAVAISDYLADTVNNNELTQVFGVFAFIGVAAFFIFAVCVIAITVLPGVLGIICSMKNGKFAFGCLIIGSTGALRGLMSLIDNIIQGESIGLNLIIFLYFGLYTTGAVMVYINKKADKS